MAGVATIEDERAQVRAAVFSHLAGIVLAPTVKALWERGVFEAFEGFSTWIDLDRVLARTSANRGYLRVALRLLAACGWLEQRVEQNGKYSRYRLTTAGRIALEVAPSLYAEIVSFIPKALYLDDFLFGESDEPILPSLRALVQRTHEGWGLSPRPDPIAAAVCQQIRGHLDGIVIAPAMVALARGGVLDKLEHGPVDPGALPGNHDSLMCLLEFLATQGWVTQAHNQIALTPGGRYAAQIASSYGVTVSYLATFEVVSTLLFGDPRIPPPGRKRRRTAGRSRHERLGKWWRSPNLFQESGRDHH